MKAIVVHQQDNDVPQLIWEDVDQVSYQADDVLVEVKASAVNRADLMQALGAYPPPPGASEILGLEMSGVISAVGAAVTDWHVGDRVCALLPGGGYAEQVAVPSGMLLPVPEGWDFIKAAAVPEVWYTAFVNLFLEGQLQAGETVLIHAGASGVGTAAIQLAREAGATVIVTAGAEHKLETCHELGAHLAINYKEQDFLTEVLAFTKNKGVNLILDPVGASYLDKNLRALTRLGRLVHIGFLGGSQTEINLGLVLGKRLHMIGSTLRSRPTAEKVAITEQFKARFWAQLLDGTLRPIVDTTFPMSAAQEAHAYVRQNRNTGKVVLVVA
jgi:putative PIG3 family NAD(P)H quinone oxidoreductase